MNIFQKPKVETLSDWLEVATRKLEEAAKERIRTEIEAHYAEAVEGYLADGLPETEARAAALNDLGNARTAARRFRRQHFTEREIKTLKSFDSRLRSFSSIAISYFYFLVVADRDLGRSHYFYFPWLIFILEAIVLLVLPTVCFLAAKRSDVKAKRILLIIYPFSGVLPGIYLGVSFERPGAPFGLWPDLVLGLLFLNYIFAYLRLWYKLGKVGANWSGNSPTTTSQA